MSHLRAVFPRIVAVIYTGGTVAHLVRLYVGFTWSEIPFFIDWLLVVLGAVGVTGLIAFARQVDYRGAWEKIVHWLIVLHLGVSVLVHVWILIVHSHKILSPFPHVYSYFAVGYFGFFAWRSWTLRLRDAP